MSKISIKNLSENELLEFFAKINEKKFRAKQLFDALYKKRINSFSEISNFPAQLINILDKNFTVNSLTVENIFESNDSSKKILFKTVDNEFIETVFLPNSSNESQNNKNTICISTMVGCPINCEFCATAKIGFKRNLDVSEIIDQLFLTEKNVGERADNIVFMGMGEPFLNYENVINSLKIISKNEIISKKNITVSTVGIPEKIIDFANEDLKIKLALSLHSPFDEVRKTLIPVAKKYQIEEILKSLDYYYQTTKIPITFEYILFKNLNDRDEDVKKLARISRRFPSKINIIPFNDISFIDKNIDLIPATVEEIKVFAKKLYDENVMAITRKSQGSDIAAACGQLALQSKNCTESF
jgi:23S rRNA (adenine2503-C2)-methyltransferase